jgi:hypothetical protein
VSEKVHTYFILSPPPLPPQTKKNVPICTREGNGYGFSDILTDGAGNLVETSVLGGRGGKGGGFCFEAKEKTVRKNPDGG